MAPTAGKRGNIFNQFFLFRGATSFLFGCAVLEWAMSDQGFLGLSFFLFTFIDGLLALVFSFRAKNRGNWIFRADGVTSLVIAGLTFIGPVVFGALIVHTGSILLPYLIIGRFLITGMFQILAIRFLKEPEWNRVVAVMGIVAVVFGAILTYFLPEMQFFTAMVGVCSLLIGFFLIVIKFVFPRKTAHAPA